MVFSSPIFLFCFLPLTLLLYFVVPRHFKNHLLLAASLLFYAWGEPYAVFLMLLSIGGNYLLGRLVSAGIQKDRKPLVRGVLTAAVILNIGLLVIYKYSGFLVENLNLLLRTDLPVPDIPLPIGISFFTFQALSYVIDIYRGEGLVQKNIFSLALYISCFPQLIAGPIVRYRDMDEQIRHREVDYNQIRRGVGRFIVGLAKKVMIANVAGEVADQIFNVPAESWTPGMAWLAMASYSFQIYFDFSGYSDMAIGLGRMFGFEFLENFRYPYIAQSIREFWRRWHISLSTWFRDYVYIPLGGSRVGGVRLYMNQLIVFFLCGLWHGASWNFALWGLWHGAFLVIERMGLGPRLDRAWRPVRHAYTLGVVMIGWVFFRAEALSDAGRILRAMAGGLPAAGEGYSASLYITPLWLVTACAGVIASTPLPIWVWRQIGAASRTPLRRLLWGMGTLVCLLGFLVYCAVTVAGSAYNPFIYFRF